MNITERISAFTHLGDRLAEQLKQGKLNELFSKAYLENQWFTPENSAMALKAIIEEFLSYEKIKSWLDRYNMPGSNEKPATVGLVLAGNVPLVGWHDLMCVLMSGNIAQVKLSSKDKVLPMIVINTLMSVEPGFAGQIFFTDQLKDFEAVIATGSNNTLRYFDYYFGKYRHILRRNRNSVAILTGNESEEQITSLGYDIMNYFGLGCRNVSTLLLPEGYDFHTLFAPMESWSRALDHTKYANNYMYNKSLLLLNKEKHLDNGFMLLKESPVMATPVSVIHYQFYRDTTDIENFLAANTENIQCIVSMPGIFENSVNFGQTQKPQLWDYADGVDVMEFLLSL